MQPCCVTWSARSSRQDKTPMKADAAKTVLQRLHQVVQTIALVGAPGASAAKPRRPRVLLVGNAASIHVARFLALLQEQGFDARLFHGEESLFFEDESLNGALIYISDNDEYIHCSGRNRLMVTFQYPFRITIPIDRIPIEIRKIARAVGRRFNSRHDRVQSLIHVMRSFAPDLVISARMQCEGYLVSEAKAAMAAAFTAPWIHFLWGTDIEFFGKVPEYRAEHLPRIRRALGSCDCILADTQRDLDQAPLFGFRGRQLGVLPAHGGFDPEWLDAIRLSAQGPRDVILIKSREGSYVGRAMTILKALGAVSERLAGYKIVALLATPNVRAYLPEFSARYGLSVEVAEQVPYDDLMRLYARSRLAISATTVDGMPSFLAEAMSMGALPIHSDMTSIREWIDDGHNGLLFPVDDVEALKRAIVRGLDDDDLFHRAEQYNRTLVDQRLNRKTVGPAVNRIILDIISSARQDRLE
jgi:glycosyltransferase involved in cell wall biosynthesis